MTEATVGLDKTTAIGRDAADLRPSRGRHLSALGAAVGFYFSGLRRRPAVCRRDCCVSLLTGFRWRGRAGAITPHPGNAPFHPGGLRIEQMFRFS